MSRESKPTNSRAEKTSFSCSPAREGVCHINARADRQELAVLAAGLLLAGRSPAVNDGVEPPESLGASADRFRCCAVCKSAVSAAPSGPAGGDAARACL